MRTSALGALAITVMCLLPQDAMAGDAVRLLVLVSGGEQWDYARELALKGVEAVFLDGVAADAFAACDDDLCRATIARRLGAQAAVYGTIDVRNDLYSADLRWVDARTAVGTPIRIGSHVEAGDAPMVDALVRDWVARATGRAIARMPAGHDAQLLDGQMETLHYRLVRTCAERPREPGEQDPVGSWEMKVSLRIDPDGAVVAVDRKEQVSSAPTTPVQTCALRELREASFFRGVRATTVTRELELTSEEFVLASQRFVQSLIPELPVGFPPMETPKKRPLPGQRIANVLASPLRFLEQGNRLLVFPASLVLWSGIALPLARRRWKRGDHAGAVRGIRVLGVWLLVLSLVPVLLSLAWTETLGVFLFGVSVLALPLAFPGAVALALAQRLARKTG